MSRRIGDSLLILISNCSVQFGVMTVFTLVILHFVLLSLHLLIYLNA